jgi:hypothetical protein
MSGFVYFISYGETGWVKIGYATEIKSRLTALQCSSPEKLTVEATIPANPKHERLLHKILGRHRGRREWFRPCELISLIIEFAIRGDTAEQIIAFAKDPPAPPEMQRQREVLQWTRWVNDETLPDLWRDRYRQWLLDDYGIQLLAQQTEEALA